MKVLYLLLAYLLLCPPALAGDEQQINQALEHGGNVTLENRVYEITGPIYIHSNTVLTGGPDTIIRVSSSSSQWFTGSTGIVTCIDPNNIEISGFQIDGNLENLPSSYHSNDQDPHDCERAIYIIGSSGNRGNNVSIHDMKIYDTFSDGINARFCNNVNCYNIFASDCQHDAIFYVDCLGGTVHDCEIAGICDDCARLDNCQNVKLFGNIFYSYSGDHNNGDYEHGEFGLQIGDEGRSFGTGSPKPDHTKNIEVCNNTFANCGLGPIRYDPQPDYSNIYIHDNQVYGAAELKTMGVPVDVGNYSYENPPSLQTSEKVFKDIFDYLLNANYQDSGITNQTADGIPIQIKQTENGIVAGGVKIVGFKDKIKWNNETYIHGIDSVLVKSEAFKTPSLDFFSFRIDNMTKNVSVSIENGTAIATMTVTTSYYSTYTNRLTGKIKKGSIQKSVVTFMDSYPSPKVLDSPKNITGLIYQYPTFFMVSVPSNGLVKVNYEYAGNSTEHIYAVGERQTDEQGIQYTEFSNLDHWEGNIQHQANWLYVLGNFDKSKLKVTAYTPYEKVDVTDFNIVKKDYPQTIIANWFYAEVAFMITCFIFIWWIRTQIIY